jgi:tetratricopeptide (TPR) repeat protein
MPILHAQSPSAAALSASPQTLPENINNQKQLIRELLIEEALPQRALETLKPLLASHPNDPELWIYASAAYQALGNQPSSTLYELKVEEWAKSNSSSPGPQVWLALLKHLKRSQAESIEIAQQVMGNTENLGRLSAMERKVLFWTMGSAINSELTYFSSNRQQMMEAAINYLNRALEISISPESQFNRFINYRCHFLLARAYGRLARYEENSALKDKLLQRAISEFDRALKIRPNAWRTCMEWKAIIEDNNLPEILPKSCYSF